MPHPLPESMEDVVHERQTLLGLGYRMLGSLADAEDAAQEAYARWYRLSEEERNAVASSRAWLVTTASRVCLDMLRSARARRELYVGEWLPDPLPASTPWALAEATDNAVEVGESVSMALLVVLDRMTPAERLAFVLHDVFGYSFAEVAAILGRSPEACRQLGVSARRRLSSTHVEPRRDPRRAGLVSAFEAAWASRDVKGLLALLDPSATVITDGGGVVSASLPPVTGREPVAALLFGAFNRQPGLTLRVAQVNGEPGIVAQVGGVIVAVVAFGFADGLVRNLWVVRNPSKLCAWN